jgi:hypothetical protein
LISLVFIVCFPFHDFKDTAAAIVRMEKERDSLDSEKAKELCKKSWIAKDRLWNQRKFERVQQVEKTLQMHSSSIYPKFVFDVWNPEFDCGKEFRVGEKFSDGGKWMCDPTGLFGLEYQNYINSSSCIVYVFYWFKL